MADITLEELLTRSTPAVQELILKTREAILEAMPGAVERVHSGWSAIWYGTNSKMSAQLFAISPQRAYVNLQLANGAALPDPDHLLEGTGKYLRHIKIRRPDDPQRPEVKALLQRAVESFVPA